MTKPTMASRKKAPASIQWCHRMGTALAVAQWPRSRVIAWLAEGGFEERGITARRVLRSYNEQLQRG